MILSSELIRVTPSGNTFLDALTWEFAYASGVTINYVFQGKGTDGPNGGATWSADNARANFNLALQSWADVAKIVFLEMPGPYNGVGSTSQYDWIEELGTLDSGIAGEHDLPFAGTLTGTYNNRFGYIDSLSVRPGGAAYSTFVHEIGHGLGLLHPHNDAEDPAGDPAFPGVVDSSDLGTARLNQGVFSVMTYNSGYEDVGLAPSYDYGWEMGPQPFDIAAVQRLYGAQTGFNNTDTAYALPTANSSGTGWRAIWDGGGIDEIAAGTTTSPALIDLRAATLKAEAGGGGFVSRVVGIVGGVTIAANVVIENARGGAGDDWIHGNSADNRIDGGAGYDTVDFTGSLSDLSIDLSAGTARGDGSDTLVSIEGAVGGLGNDMLRAIAGVEANTALIDLIKRSDAAIGSRETAMVLDGLFGDRTGDRFIPGAVGLESVVIQAQGGGTVDYYTFMVDVAGSVTFDIDNSFILDSEIRLYDSAGTLLAENDDWDRLDPGSANTLDSLLTYGATAGQRLIVEVRRVGGDGSVPIGSSYDLNIVMDAANPLTGTLLRGSVLSGGGGNDVLYSGSGNDILDGGSGADTAVFGGVRSAYSVTAGPAGTVRVSGGGDGTDTLYGIEKLRFANGEYRWDTSTLTLIGENAPPVVAASQMLATPEDAALQVNIGATDPDGDALTWQVLSMPSHGVLTGGSAGVFLYMPGTNFSGSDSFVVRISDTGGRSADQTVAITVQPVNDVPLLNPTSTSISAPFGGSQSFVLTATDADGDALSYSSTSPAHGLVTLNASGTHQYNPAAGYSGPDSFTVTVSDGRGGTASQSFGVTVQAPPPSDPTFRLYATDGFRGGVGGSGTVFGSNGFQDISVFDLPGTINFDASFNRGGDIIRLPGNADSYTVFRSGATVTISDSDSRYTIPAGPSGMSVIFADGTWSLAIADGAIRLGAQAITSEAAGLSALGEPGFVVSPFDDEAAAKVFLEANASVDVAGKVSLFGSTGNEQVTWRGGALTLDPSFNKGGDVLHMAGPNQLYSAYRSGSSLVIFNDSGSVTLPFGPVGMTVDFAGVERTAVFDIASSQLLVGSQIITGTNAANATQLLLGTASSFATLG